MLSDHPIGGILLFIILFLLLFVFYLYRGAIHNITASEEEEDTRLRGMRKRIVMGFLQEKRTLLDRMDVLTALILLIMGSFYTPWFAGRLNRLLHVPWLSSVVAFALMLAVLFLFGIFIPLRIGTKSSKLIVVKMAVPVWIFVMTVTPFVVLLSVTGKCILRIFGIRKKDYEKDVTEDEILSIVNEGQEQGVLDENEATLINNILSFTGKTASEICVHRSTIEAISIESSLQDAVEYMLNKTHSRFPVYDEDIDHIVGIIHIKDVLKKYVRSDDATKKLTSFRKLIMDVLCVPETKNIDDLFKEMKSKKAQMAILVDEYGQTAGLLSMEDILEEIVGDIEDEYDRSETFIETKKPDEYVMDGLTPIESVEEELGADFSQYGCETLNGLLIRKMEHVPVDGEEYEVSMEGYTFRILEAKDNIIREVLVTKAAKCDIILSNENES